MSAFESQYGKWVIPKDPAAKLNYGIDWGPWLPAGDSVASATWTVDGVTKEADSIVGNIAYVKISGGPASGMASARCTITTANSAEIQPQTLYFRMAAQ
jgi:hypothetical protein